MTQDKINTDNLPVGTHYNLVKAKASFPSFKNVEFEKFLIEDTDHVTLKSSLIESIEYGDTIEDEELQRAYFVKVMKVFDLPSGYRIVSMPMLKVACQYSIGVLEDDKRDPWCDHEIYDWIEKLGEWVGALCIKKKIPVPIEWLNIPYEFRRCIEFGVAVRGIRFVKGYLRKSKIRPPNCVCVLLLEIMAALKEARGLKLSVYQAIAEFEETLHIDLTAFARRSIFVPLNSFDRYAQFVSEKDSIVFQNPRAFGYQTPDKFHTANKYIAQYFDYVPDLTQLPTEFKEVIDVAQMIEKYFFIGHPCHVKAPVMDLPENVVLQSIVSMALSPDAVIAQFGSRMLYKIVQKVKGVDLAAVFRTAFPNKYVLSSCFEANCIEPAEINGLFCDLLTSPSIRNFALDRIKALIPICLASSTPKAFCGVLKLCGMDPPSQQPSDIGFPDPKHLPLLEAFLEYCQDPSDSASFVERMKIATTSSLRSLLLFVFHATKSTASPLNSTKIDYSTIDNFCYGVARCTGKSKFEENIVSAIKSIAHEVSAMYPLSLFRLLHGLITNRVVQSDDLLIQLIDHFVPSKYPTFSCCWMQLCAHRAVFPRLVQINSTKSMNFCVKYVMTCIELCKEQPDVFYRPVTRILMAITSSYPQFVVSYFALFLEKLPISFTQLRNVILKAYLPPSEDQPPMGFKCGGMLYLMGQQILTKDMIVSDDRAEKIADVLRKTLKPGTIYVPRVVWALVVYYLSQIKSDTADLLVLVCRKFTDESVRMIIIALIDQLRYENLHTTKALNTLHALFKTGSELHRELILTELIRRLMCVTRPPDSVDRLFHTLNDDFGDEIWEMVKKRGEYDIYKRVLLMQTRMSMSGSHSSSSVSNIHE